MTKSTVELVQGLKIAGAALALEIVETKASECAKAARVSDPQPCFEELLAEIARLKDLVEKHTVSSDEKTAA